MWGWNGYHVGIFKRKSCVWSEELFMTIKLGPLNDKVEKLATKIHSASDKASHSTEVKNLRSLYNDLKLLADDSDDAAKQEIEKINKMLEKLESEISDKKDETFETIKLEAKGGQRFFKEKVPLMHKEKPSKNRDSCFPCCPKF